MDRRYFVTRGAANATYQERRINTSHVMVVHIVQNVRYEQNDRGVAQIPELSCSWCVNSVRIEEDVALLFPIRRERSTFGADVSRWGVGRQNTIES